MIFNMFDGLVNVVANLGTGKDKAASSGYSYSPLQMDQIDNAYAVSGLVQRIVDLPAEDACREWREWQGIEEEITLIEAEEKRLKLKLKTLESLRLARKHGGSALLIVDNEQDLTKPLEPSVGKGGIKYLTLLNRHEVNPGDYERDPRKDYYGEPSQWQLAVDSTSIPWVHPSRIAAFYGVEPVKDLKSRSTQWPDSVLQSTLSKVRNLDEVAGNILALVYEAKIDVFNIPNLMKQLEQSGGKFEKQLLKRLSLANTTKSVNNSLVMDGDETYTQKHAQFSTLDKILEKFMVLVSAQTGIPMTLLFGESPGGLNATGESDTRHYYDRIKVFQTLRITPKLDLFDECLINSALGSRPPRIHYTWRPLWQPSAKERAETSEVLAKTIVAAIAAQLLSTEAGSEALVNALTENGSFPGLDKSAELYPVTKLTNVEEIDLFGEPEDE